MNEWAVVGVIVVLIGLISAIVTPLIKLNTSITTLTVAVSTLKEGVKDLIAQNSESHKELWEHNASQDRTINNHESRLCVIEQTGKGAD